MAPLLEVTDLEAGYGPINVLHRVSIAVQPGEIVATIGANGAGKTTTLMRFPVLYYRGQVRFALRARTSRECRPTRL